MQGPWRLTGAAAKADNLTSKALCVSFQLNVTSLYCSIRNTCVNIPQVLVQKVNGSKLVPWVLKMKTNEVGRGRKVPIWRPCYMVIY